MIRILTYSSLYPNAAQPRHGLFVEHRLRHLVAAGEVAAQVVAPVPWFPLRAEAFGRYARFAAVPRRERRHGIEVVHPRHLVIPKIGMRVAPALMAHNTESAVRNALRAAPDTALIDAHYFYPDGVAAARLGRRLGLPVVITARGSDVNVIAALPGPRRQILAAARSAAAVITVAEALRSRLIELGVDGERIVVLRNGVDHTFFHPVDRNEARATTRIAGPTLLSVGNLVELKGHHLVIEALTELPAHNLVIVGEGPQRNGLEALGKRLGVADRLRLVGAVDQAALRDYYCAADALVLASSREGMANVLLETLACGTPAIATAVSGNPEVIADPAAGLLLEQRSAAAIVAAVNKLAAAPPQRNATLGWAQRFSWHATTEGQTSLFRKIAASRDR